MSNRLFVGNLSYEVSGDAVRAFFGACGDVSSVHVVMDRDSGCPRGFAFVTMATDDGAANAVARLDRSMFEGRSLRVSVAEESARRTSRDDGARRRHLGAW